MTTVEDLYAEFLTAAPDGLKVVAHLGSSLDGRIATACGHSSFVTGHANLVHMHRLRALADAVLIGAGTVAADDPQLTVRLVEGRSPVRVILDPDRRLGADYRVFSECPPRTIVISSDAGSYRDGLGRAELVDLPCVTPEAVLRCLRDRGLRRIFIEGGGITVSRFLAAGCLDQLQICIAPVIIGSGRASCTLPEIGSMADALRPRTRTLPMGDDVLFVCEPERRTSLGQPEQVEMADAAA
jgi:riboflavin-specific deaminase-like protein